jgi:hypothetical protein
MLALEPFFDRFVLGSFLESLLDHFVGGTVVLPPGFVRLYAEPGSAL